MRLPLDWILQEPIDVEHKEYVLLDYISKIDKELEEFRLYPTFQELSLHLANLKSITDNLKKLVLKKEPIEDDDEILLDDIGYENLSGFSNNELKEIVKISKYSNDKLRDYFLIAKSVWSIVFESILIKPYDKSIIIDDTNFKKGYLFFTYNNENYLYRYDIKKLNRKYKEEKCEFKLIRKGKDVKLSDRNKKHLVFIADFDNEFPLEGSLLSLIKRKIINYIAQTIKLSELKEGSIK